MNKDCIDTLEIDLIDACNLSCPLCNRNVLKSKDGYIPLEDWISILDQYKYLRAIYLIGTRSEHTLYPEFLNLMRYFKSRGLSIIISTNGCTNKLKFWSELKDILQVEDEVRFAVDGITQDIYEQYRVGGNLEKLMNNHKAFKSEKDNDIMQYIRFEHNQHEDITEFLQQFSGLRTINSSFEGNHDGSIVKQTPKDSKKYDLVTKVIRNRKPNISCITKGNMHFINHRGQTSPCCHYNEDVVLQGGEWDGTYEDIEAAKFDFCTIICDKFCTNLLKSLDIEL
jgi:MoaA/NifB/PqqE/SkfB family radical SAM enzyme